MKRKIALLLAVTLLLCMVGCNGNSNAETTGDTMQATQQTENPQTTEPVNEATTDDSALEGTAEDTTPDPTAEPTSVEENPTDPDPTEPPTEPKPTTPVPTEPTPTEPKPTVPTEPKPTEPKPTEPTPTVPAPTEPKPTTPAPAEPAPTVPTPTEPESTAPSTEDRYILNDDLLFEKNIEEILKQCQIYSTQRIGPTTMNAQIAGKFGNSDVDGFFEFQYWGNELYKNSFRLSCTMSDANEIAEDVYYECINGYGVTNFSTLYSENGNWIDGEDCDTIEVFTEYIAKVINGETDQVQFYGTTKRIESTGKSYMFKITVSNISNYIAIAITPHEFA